MLVVVGGITTIAVRVSNAELPPFWGAFLRYAVASFVLLGAVVVWRMPLPDGRALAGSVLYGVANFAGSPALFYWGVLHVDAGLAQVLMSLIPLMTLFLAAAHRIEVLRTRALCGGLLATAGILVVSVDQLRLSVPLVSLLAVVGAAACAAEAGVLVKAFPPVRIVPYIALSMAAGAALLLVMSVLAREDPIVPGLLATWAALAYLVPVGSIGTFLLYLYVLQRWTASMASYQFVLFPFVTVTVGATVGGERMTWPLLAGGGLVLLGVYVGALTLSAAIAESRRV